MVRRAGTEVRAIHDDTGDEPLSWTRRDWNGTSRGSMALPETDDALSRRIADILTREARRHGVEIAGVEP